MRKDDGCMKCINCKHNTLMTDEDGVQFSWCKKKNDNLDIHEHRDCKYFEVATNAGRIRCMTDEELAGIMFDYKECTKNCIMSNGNRCYQVCAEKGTILKWLKQPYK